jgi:two-component system chemotaxis response regulator CheB
MMASAAEHYGANSMGVILTGMGNDGRNGMLEIKTKGGYTIAEAESSAVVFGMPSEAIKNGGRNSSSNFRNSVSNNKGGQ